MLAQSEQVVLEACRALGWTYAAPEQVLKPVEPEGDAPAFDGFAELERLTAVATHLSE